MIYYTLLLLVLLLSGCSKPVDPDSVSGDDFAQQREEMIRVQLKSRGIDNEAVLNAFRIVPRHIFVPEPMRQYAYVDSPLPIGEGQTVSQPYIVALMTESVNPKPGDRALEIGTGSGFQAAILSQVVKEVYSIEILPELTKRAKEVLKEAGYKNIFIRQGDGFRGWPEKAPFDVILVTAAAPVIPPPLTDQLAENGRLVMPLGGQEDAQSLILVVKKNGKLEQSTVTSVRFVPMTGEIEKR